MRRFEHLRAQSEKEQVQGVGGGEHLPAQSDKISVQGVRRRGHLMGGGICQHNRSKCKECGESSIF